LPKNEIKPVEKRIDRQSFIANETLLFQKIIGTEIQRKTTFEK